MPLNSHLMKAAWIVQKNVLIGAVLIMAVAGGYYQFSVKPSQEAADEKKRLESLLEPENFDARALSELVVNATAPEEMKLLVLAAIAQAEKNPATIPLAVKQVRMMLAAKPAPNP